MLYIELKTDSNDRGPAWIGLAKLSKSGKTVFFNGKAFSRGAVIGNHHDVETGESYWISGVKKDGTDRHWAGGGKIMIDARIVDEYMAFRGLKELPERDYQIVNG